MTVKLNINIELHNVSSESLLELQKTLQLHLINEPINNSELIKGFSLDVRPLLISRIEKVTAGLDEIYTLDIVG